MASKPFALLRRGVQWAARHPRRPPRVYLAGRFERRPELRAFAEELSGAGWEVTSSWLFVDSEVRDGLHRGGRAAELAEMDLRDVRRSDVCVSFTEDGSGPLGRGGRHFELGVAV